MVNKVFILKINILSLYLPEGFKKSFRT